MLTGNHYFSPEVISAYFHNLENILDTNNNRVILLGDFNAPDFNWEIGALYLNVTTIPS
jgi:endonuclease/exonuclease/phosphatase (EEP) superfamily protein YafD